MPLPSGAVTSLTVAPAVRVAFHHAAMRSAIADGIAPPRRRENLVPRSSSPSPVQMSASCGRQSGTSVGSPLMRRVLTDRLTRLTGRPHARRAVAAIAVAAVASACLPPPPPPPPKPPVLDAACDNTLIASSPGTVASDAITEASGIAASPRFDDVYWVHNDSGDTARVFAISGTGQTLGEYALSGATAVDWEDIAAGPGPTPGVSYLYVGDIGDNAATRTSVQVYRVPEPSVDPDAPASSPQTLTGVATLTLKYPDGPHDAEALLARSRHRRAVRDHQGPRRRRRPGVPGAAQPRGRLDHDAHAGRHRVTRRGAGRHRRRHDRRGRRDRAPHLLRRVPLSPMGGETVGQALAHTSCPGAAPPFGSARRRRNRRARRSGSRATGGAT